VVLLGATAGVQQTVVLRYRLALESRHLASATINLRLAAVRRLANEAADTGLLSPELAADIAREGAGGRERLRDLPQGMSGGVVRRELAQ
jgi:hypothetical protein